ncbi:hypothetical protein MLD63_05285 [Paracoccus sp. TK19116]|uniref:SRPBCC family protein n=1 Tax=Paracoccus albicereus TaxID=2922394 RepID=A0ABT1MNH7_9RHOB|nr:hypothetical protein [Paracoccus albicereus]MCQ0969840.1 hypothetical protein [Paracoccus albicereus]
MKFSTRVDTDRSAPELFAAISDFDRIAKMLISRGVAVEPIAPDQDPGTGMAWFVTFDWRGRERRLRMDVTRFDRPEKLTIAGSSEPFDLIIDMTVVALSRERARLIFETDVRPRNIRARLMLQTAKLGKTQLDERYRKRIDSFVENLLVPVA